MEWISPIMIEVPAVVGTCFYFLNRRIGKVEAQINNGLTGKVNKLSVDMAFLRGQHDAEHGGNE